MTDSDGEQQANERVLGTGKKVDRFGDGVRIPIRRDLEKSSARTEEVAKIAAKKRAAMGRRENDNDRPCVEAGAHDEMVQRYPAVMVGKIMAKKRTSIVNGGEESLQSLY